MSSKIKKHTLYTPEEVARIFHIPTKSLTSLMSEGKLAYSQLTSNQRLIIGRDLIVFLKAKTVVTNEQLKGNPSCTQPKAKKQADITRALELAKRPSLTPVKKSSH